jgi:glycosyltransferase involved in cell wall biosynthesis
MRIPDEELADWLAVAEVVAIPYRSFLNSTVLVLSLSLGVPVVGPRCGTLRELSDVGLAPGVVYDVDDPMGLQKALERALDVGKSALRDVEPAAQYLTASADETSRSISGVYATAAAAGMARSGRGFRRRSRP